MSQESQKPIEEKPTTNRTESGELSEETTETSDLKADAGTRSPTKTEREEPGSGTAQSTAAEAKTDSASAMSSPTKTDRG